LLPDNILNVKELFIVVKMGIEPKWSYSWSNQFVITFCSIQSCVSMRHL